MNGWPDLWVYLALAAGAAIENVVPAVPADTFVALGGFLAGAGDLDARWVALGTWMANVAGALTVYRLSHAHGPSFFSSGLGRYVLRPHQMDRMAGFYERWGVLAIFGSRFLPGVRSIVPVFAGATHQPWPRVALPIAAASAIWYTGLVALGVFAGQNVEELAGLLESINRTLGGLALVVGVLITVWWIRTRRHADE
jgi:membrane protein DedA with SNARE-associated domain